VKLSEEQRRWRRIDPGFGVLSTMVVFAGLNGEQQKRKVENGQRAIREGANAGMRR
jgi:hypothetical protein